MGRRAPAVDDLFPDGDRPGTQPRRDIFRSIDRPIWTENKATLIQRYLQYFVFITKHGTYIDGFAGPQEPDKPEMWSAKLVLESRPRWLRNFFLCDKDPAQVSALQALVDAQAPREKGEPKRRIRVLPGDFNESVDAVLSEGVVDSNEAAFALLDQRTFECRWATVERLAGYKQATGNKIEIFYFLPIKWLHRALSGIGKHSDEIARWWGRSDWRELQRASTESIRLAVVDRLRKELDYAWVAPWPIFERAEGGAIMYYMIHATDHPEAPKLMQRAYRTALKPMEPSEQIPLLLEIEDGVIPHRAP
jgi:three-Cys-motif partner protein